MGLYRAPLVVPGGLRHHALHFFGFSFGRVPVVIRTAGFLLALDASYLCYLVTCRYHHFTLNL